MAKKPAAAPAPVEAPNAQALFGDFLEDLNKASTKLMEAIEEAVETIAESFTTLVEILDGQIMTDEEEEPPVEETKPAARRGAKPAAEAPATKAAAPKASGRGKAPAKPEPEPKEDDPVTLEDIQELSATLLENGKRKVVTGLLKEFGLKSLGEAEEDQFDELYDAFFDEVEALDA